VKTVADERRLAAITRTAAVFSSGIDIDDLKRPKTHKIKSFNDFFAIFGCGARFKSGLRQKCLKLDQNNLRTRNTRPIG